MIVTPLGQVGYLFDFDGYRIVIDPYLTDSVAEQFGEELRRLCQPTIPAAECLDVKWILLTHAHLDHTDPASLSGLLRASPEAMIMAPADCLAVLQTIPQCAGKIRVVDAGEKISLTDDILITIIPAAHTALEYDDQGRCRYIGYHLQANGLGIYHAGDTIPHQKIVDSLKNLPIDYAFLPVNERNYFRDQKGIVGNMTVREAFEFAEVIKAATLVPTHWDLFAPNSTFSWEVVNLHAATRPDVKLQFMPTGTTYAI